MESRQKKRPRISMTDQGLLQGISHALIENPTEEMLSEEYGVDLDSEEDSNNVCSFNKGQSSGLCFGVISFFLVFLCVFDKLIYIDILKQVL